MGKRRRNAVRALSLAFPQVTADFQQFWQTQTRSDYAHRAATAKVADPTAFAEMQRYLFNRYNGLSVLATLHQGPQVFDCIAQAQQPGMRDGRQAATPPQLAARGPQAAATDAQRCPQGTVPLQRIGIADLARHANLQAFLQSDSLPLAASRTSVSPAAVSDGHYYSTVYFDTGNAAVTGAGADINLWAPTLRSSDEQQTISQVWIVGQSDTQQTQTLEVGWEAQPAAGWGNLPIVFIYSTQDGYAHTGCHNLDCADFVQTSNRQILGSRPSAGYSVAGQADADGRGVSAQYRRQLVVTHRRRMDRLLQGHPVLGRARRRTCRICDSRRRSFDQEWHSQPTHG
ncbi:DUF239 domain-containing protein [Xanthomonas vasicola]|uniref:DUF239 domain-containing protein n=1 Tax=Xanthomonas vasicola TaxID=56459 RepID=A0ABD7S808_XANVA|nr:DUF239 domain-containing protein [Xanthomonas vasicola]TWQ34742.1 DUF239 domain-containing protein [Xanthomonas vasicola]TWQ49902.1 DUF239 domain-containing protein [Xanthomonas vasicola]TWQ52352.1 DUF239 domain-containing protein [Xanthomonas vasicola]TWQ54686.1 DUF239 domain-containing protein [Xanthomonas vasicola]